HAALFGAGAYAAGIAAAYFEITDPLLMTVIGAGAGGVAGLVTIEDVLEEIVGEIADEHDIEEEDFITEHSPANFTVKALTPIQEFNQRFGTDFSDEEFDTIGGVLMHHFGRLPKRGEALSLGKLRFKVLRADSRRLHLIQVSLRAPADEKVSSAA
ncbi:MAG: transporter associated domain-containing protein, partial [Gammaproteobacteria bacterium]